MDKIPGPYLQIKVHNFNNKPNTIKSSFPFIVVFSAKTKNICINKTRVQNFKLWRTWSKFLLVHVYNFQIYHFIHEYLFNLKWFYCLGKLTSPVHLYSVAFDFYTLSRSVTCFNCNAYIMLWIWITNINIKNSNLTQTIHVTKFIYNCLNNRKHNVKFITTVFGMVPK